MTKSVKPTQAAILIVLSLCLFTLAGCGEQSDAEILSGALHNTAWNARESDRVFQSALDSLETLQAGRPSYEVAAELADQVSQLDIHIVNLAVLREKKATAIQSQAVREPLRAGLLTTHTVYKLKWKFLGEIERALARGQIPEATTVAQNYRDLLAFSDTQLIQAMASFSDAKAAAGLPRTLDEFH